MKASEESERPSPQRRNSCSWVEIVKHDPLTALAIAATVGFLVGGGASTHAGRSMLALIGRIAAPGAALNLVAGMVMSNHDSTRRADFKN